MEKEVLMGQMEGKRGRGRLRRRWLDGIKETTKEGGGIMREMENRSRWKEVTTMVTRGWTRLDGTL